MPKKTAYHHGALKSALLNEAATLIRAQGTEAVTMRELATRLGVSRTAAYRHFENKEALLVAVAAEGFERLAMALHAAGEGQTGRDRVEAMGQAYVRFALANPAHYRLMYGREALRRREIPALQAAADQAYDELVALIEAEQHSGLLRAGDARQLVYVAWALVHGLALLLVDGQMEEPDDTDALAALAIRTLLDGLAA
ncbi:MAG: TetR/AcrR family transcriptional regulator [Rhodothermaceae bacterium]|nr:TetR/AcrR family transcriptional regulator [Rhodothermaceae bacterium]